MANDFTNIQDVLAWELVTNPANRTVVKQFLTMKAQERTSETPNVYLCVNDEQFLTITTGQAPQNVVAKIDNVQAFDEISHEYALEFDYETVLMLSDEISDNLNTTEFEISEKEVIILKNKKKIAVLENELLDNLFDGKDTNELIKTIRKIEFQNNLLLGLI